MGATEPLYSAQPRAAIATCISNFANDVRR